MRLTIVLFLIIKNEAIIMKTDNKRLINEFDQLDTVLFENNITFLLE